MQKSICAVAILAATSLPVMAESVDVRVTGTVVPAACIPTLSGGGTIDYGTILTDTLNATDYTVLPVKTLNLSINCTGPARVALKAVNQRVGSLANDGGEGANGVGPVPVTVSASLGVYGEATGLGMSNGRKVGGYAMELQRMIMDGKNAVGMIKKNGDWPSGTWASNVTHTLFPHGGVGIEDMKSFTTLGDNLPEAFTNFSAELRVAAWLNKASELDLTSPVLLDGLTTLEMVYL